MNQTPVNVADKSKKLLHLNRLGRKFGVLDAMILVAAGAAGAMSIRPFLRYGLSQPDLYQEFFPTIGSLRYIAYLDTAFKFSGPWVASLTVAFLIIRLRKPRQPLRRLMRQPGMIACVAATSLLSLEAIGAAVVFATFGLPNLDVFYFKHLQNWIDSASVAVVAVWGLIAMTRKWKPEPSWIDRLGRSIGTMWLFMFALSWSFSNLSVSIDYKYNPPLVPYESPEEEKERERQREAAQRRERELQEREIAELEQKIERVKQQNKALEKESQLLEQEITKPQKKEIQPAKP